MKNKNYFKKLLYLMTGILLSFSTWAQAPTQQWLTVLNSTTTSVDQIYGFSSPTGGCSSNANYYYNYPNHLNLNSNGSLVGFSITSGCNPFSGVLDVNSGSVVYQNTNSITQQGLSAGFDSSNNLFSLSSLGTSSLRKISSSGTVSFTNSISNGSQYNNQDFGIMRFDNQNRVYAYGLLRASSNGYFSHAVNCYDNSGVLQWTSAISELDWYYGYPGCMTMDSNNNIIFSGKRQSSQSNQNTYDIVLRKVNSSGVQQWQVYYDFGSLADYIDDIATDNAGDVYIITINTNAWSSRSRRLVKLSGATGAILFQQQISNTATSGNIKINTDGNIIVADDNVIKYYNPTNGSLIWKSASLTNYQTFTTDSSGNIYVTLKDKVQIFNSTGTLINTITPTVASYTVNLRMTEVDASGNSLYIIGERSNASTNKVFITKYNLQSYSDTCNAVSGSLTQGLVGYYPFCGNANDDSGKGNNGTVSGATLTTDRFGNANSAYSFSNGNTDSRILIGNKLNLTSFTISAWVRATGQRSSGFHSVVSNIDQYSQPIPAPNNFAMQVSVPTSSYQVVAAFGGNNTYQPNNETFNFGFNSASLNTWNHLILTFDGSTARSYKNGVLMSTLSISNYNSITSYICFGDRYNAPNYEFNWWGDLDDIGIWNRAITTQEITQLYNQNQCFTNTSVTETLVINVGQLSYTNPIAYANNITIYPNPASTQVNIAFNNISNLNGGSIKIINSLGQQVATTPIKTTGTTTSMTLSTWGGSGLYFVQIVNPQGQIVDIKKILLQ